MDARRAIFGLQPKRADVILAGACIVRAVMEKLGNEMRDVAAGAAPIGSLWEMWAALEE